MIALVVWVIAVILIGAAVLGVVRAVFATPLFASMQPYAGVVYALIVLLIVLVAVSLFYGSAGSLFPAAPRQRAAAADTHAGHWIDV